MAQHARDVACAMRAMGLGPSVVAGHSMGAFVATALAQQNPELVCGVVLIDGGYLPSISAGMPQQGLDPLLAERIVQLQQTYPSREFYRDLWRKKPHFPPQDWDAWMEAFLDYEIGGEPPNLRPKASQAAVLADLAEGFNREEIAARLRSLRVPVMLLRAETGFAPTSPPLFPDSLLEPIRALVPHIEDHKIPGTTHYTIAISERPASRVADLLHQLASHCQPSAPAAR